MGGAKPAEKGGPLRAALRAALALAIVPVTAGSPPLRGALIALEPVLAPSLVLLAVGWTVLSWFRERQRDLSGLRRARLAEATLAGFLRTWGAPLAVLAFLAPLFSQWERGPIGASAAYSALLGYIPFGDAHGHFEGANRLLHAGELNGFSERRPLNATWFAVWLAAGRESLPFALVVQTAFLGVATWMAARVVSVRVGVFPSLAFFGLVLGLLRIYVVGVLTEPLAATFSCLALAVLLSGVSRVSLGAMVVGFVCLDAALRTRPGAQFLLPFLIVWAVCMAPGRRARRAGALLAVALAGALHTGLLNRVYGSGEASATSYPAYTFYGLARGASYERATEDFGPQLARLPNEDARARFLWARAFEALRLDPRPFLRALAGNEAELLGKLPRELARVTSAGAFADSPAARLQAGPAAWRRDWLLGGTVLALLAAGFVAHLVRSARGMRLFWLAVAGGFLASAPLVLGDTGLRAMTAGLPFVALAAACGLSARRLRPARDGGRRVEQLVARGAGAMGVGVLVVCVAGPWIVRSVIQRPDAGWSSGLVPGRDAVVELEGCPAVLVSNRGVTSLGLPVVDGRALDERLNLAGLTQEGGLRRVPLPAVVLSCYDHLSTRQLLLVMPHTLARHSAGFLRLAVEPVPGDEGFLEVRSAAPLSSS